MNKIELNFVVYDFLWISWYPLIHENLSPQKLIPSILNNDCPYHAAMATKINTPRIISCKRKFNPGNLICIAYGRVLANLVN